MADNTVLNASTTVGDTLRDLARQGGTVKTQAVQLDIGGPSANAEVLVTAGQQTMAGSLPVVLASDQPAVPVSVANASLPVTGTFFPATQPVSIAGVVSTASPAVVFRGRAATYRMPGRAGTAGQKLLSLHNASGSTVSVRIHKVFVDTTTTVIKAVTVLPPIVRVYLVTVLPTNGTALVKNKIDGTGASSSSVTVLGDASADGTGSTTALTATLPAGAILTQEYIPRLITAAGYEMADRQEFFGDTEVALGPLQGIVVTLDYTLATQNAVTDMYLAGVEWTEV